MKTKGIRLTKDVLDAALAGGYNPRRRWRR